MAPAVYYLGGVLVRATTKAIRDRLLAQGFRKATKGQADSKIPIVTGTENNLIALITRAKNAIKSGKVAGSGGRNVARRKSPEEGNLLGSRGHSEFARKYGPRKMGGFGPVKSSRAKEAKDLKLAKGKRAKAKAESSAKPVSARPGNFRTGKQDKVNPALSAAPTIAGLVAAGAIGKVAYDAYIENKSPTVTQIEAANKKIAAIKARKTSTQVQRKARADAAAKRKDRVSKEGSLVGDAGTKSKRQKLAAAKADAVRRDTPARKRRIDRAVQFVAVGGGKGLKKMREDADKKALTEVLNKKIANRKSTVAKEKAKARAGEYKSLASAKKAGSLYYMHKGKELRAAITREEIRTASKKIRDEAMKKIAEGK